MLKKRVTVLAMLSLIFILAACASLKLPEAANSSTGSSALGSDGTAQPGQNQGPRQFDMQNMPVEQKLAIGTLKLEGTDLAVTADQAKTLLPLWKAVKTMSTDSNTSAEEQPDRPVFPD